MRPICVDLFGCRSARPSKRRFSYDIIAYFIPAVRVDLHIALGDAFLSRTGRSSHSGNMDVPGPLARDTAKVGSGKQWANATTGGGKKSSN